MPITVNENGVLYELSEVYSNEGGVLHELDTVHSNEGGVLHEIHSAWKAPNVIWSSTGNCTMTDNPWWTSGIDDYIISDEYDMKSITVPYSSQGSNGILTAKLNIPNNTRICICIVPQGGNIASANYVISRDGTEIKNAVITSTTKQYYTEAGEYLIKATFSVKAMGSISGDSSLTIILSYQKN